MSDIRAIVRNITLELSLQFEARLREQLITQRKEWHIDQILRLRLAAPSRQAAQVPGKARMINVKQTTLLFQ